MRHPRHPRHPHHAHHGRHGAPCCCGDSGPRITGFLVPLLLSSLEEGPSHGYQLIERLSQREVLREFPAPPVVYRHLRVLESEGMVTSALEPGEGPARKVYTITVEGKACLQDWISGLEDLNQGLEEFLKGARKRR